MTKLSITHDFVRKLVKEIREVYGTDVRHTKVLDMVAKSLGWRTDALMHMLKTRSEQHTEKRENSPRRKIIDIRGCRPHTDSEEAKGSGRLEKMQAAMRNAMRRNPDVIVIGECTDPESMEVLRAAREAGFVVWSTLENGCLGERR